MDIEQMEKVQMQRIKMYMYMSFAGFFLSIFLLTSIFILTFPLVGILDIPYPPSQIAITAFFSAFVFSLLAWKNPLAKLIMIVDILLMLFMIIFGP